MPVDPRPCPECGQLDWLETHHIIARSKGGSNEPSNLIERCAVCHKRIHGGSFGGRLRIEAGHTPEANAKRSASLRAYWASPEGRAKMMSTARGPEARAKQAESLRKWWADPANHQVHADKLRAAAKRPERNAKISETLKAAGSSHRKIMQELWQQPEFRAKMTESRRSRNRTESVKLHSPEAQARRLAAEREGGFDRSAWMKSRWADASERAKLTDHGRTEKQREVSRRTITAASLASRAPEAQAKRQATRKANGGNSEAMKARWADPEYRAKAVAAMRDKSNHERRVAAQQARRAREKANRDNDEPGAGVPVA